MLQDSALSGSMGSVFCRWVIWLKSWEKQRLLGCSGCHSPTSWWEKGKETWLIVSERSHALVARWDSQRKGLSVLRRHKPQSGISLCPVRYSVHQATCPTPVFLPWLWQTLCFSPLCNSSPQLPQSKCFLTWASVSGVLGEKKPPSAWDANISLALPLAPSWLGLHLPAEKVPLALKIWYQDKSIVTLAIIYCLTHEQV